MHNNGHSNAKHDKAHNTHHHGHVHHRAHGHTPKIIPVYEVPHVTALPVVQAVEDVSWLEILAAAVITAVAFAALAHAFAVLT